MLEATQGKEINVQVPVAPDAVARMKMFVESQKGTKSKNASRGKSSKGPHLRKSASGSRKGVTSG